MDTIDTSKILQEFEVKLCLQALRAKATRKKRPSKNAALNLIVFRLSSAAGLRRKEIVGLNMGDVVLHGPRPHLHVRAAITKAGCDGKRYGRKVWLKWDPFALEDVAAWYQRRLAMGARPQDPYLCTMMNGKVGQRLSWATVAKHWSTAVKHLGPERARQLSIHQGRHSFCSHALHVGKSAAQVRDVAGHRSITTTNLYLHAVEGDDNCRPLYGDDN